MTKRVESSEIITMTAKKNVDTVWNDIFDSLELEVEPPEYIKKITVYTVDGRAMNITPEDFASLIEYESNLPISHREIQSARMILDFAKIKRDVNKWSDNFFGSLDKTGKVPTPKFSKPEAGVIKAKARKKPVQ